MENSKWMEEIFKDLQNEDTTESVWVNITKTHFDLKTKMINALASNGKSTVASGNRRERLLIRKLLWITGLWKLELPETTETLQLIYFLKNMEVQQGIKNVPKQHSAIQTQQADNNEEKSKLFNEIVADNNFRKKKVSNKKKSSTV